LNDLEQHLLAAINICHQNTTMLDNWQQINQASLWHNIDGYTSTLKQIHDEAGTLPNNFTTERLTLLYVLYPLFSI